MTLRHIIGLACVVFVGVTAANGQDVPLLQFEITRGSVLVGRPVLLVPSGRQGMIALDERDLPAPTPRVKGLHEKIRLVPTVQGENLSIAFDIMSDSKQYRPSLVISKDVKGSFEWTSYEGQTIRLSVTWVD